MLVERYGMMTSKERIARILEHKPVDRVGLFEVFWAETAQRWVDEGHLGADGKTALPPTHGGTSCDTTRGVAVVERVEDHFNLDLRRCRAIDLIADPEIGETVVAEDETSRTVRDGNGALSRWLKGRSGAPEHIGFQVQDRGGWEEHIRPRLCDSTLMERRIDHKYYRAMRDKCVADNLCLTLGAVGVFDLMTPMCGHVNLLTGMAADPDWIRDMCDVYSRLTVDLLEAIVSAEGMPDAVWVWDDLAFKNGPFMSPAMYRDLLFPGHKRLFDWAHSRNLPVILHSDGFTAPLMPHLIEAGIDCLQPLEAKAGMDLLRLSQDFGEKVAFIAGMDARVLATNDLAKVRAELDAKRPGAMAGNAYILQVDHSVPSQVDYETYRYFVETGLEMGTYR
jgi:uroporphyrinogen decarboxylase